MNSNYRAQIYQGVNPSLVGPFGELPADPGARTRVGEARGPDLDRLGARHHELGRVPPRRDPADPDDRQVRERLTHVVDRPDGDGMDRPARQDQSPREWMQGGSRREWLLPLEKIRTAQWI